MSYYSLNAVFIALHIYSAYHWRGEISSGVCGLGNTATASLCFAFIKPGKQLVVCQSPEQVFVWASQLSSVKNKKNKTKDMYQEKSAFTFFE